MCGTVGKAAVNVEAAEPNLDKGKALITDCHTSKIDEYAVTRYTLRLELHFA
jgi:hypothetical protein